MPSAPASTKVVTELPPIVAEHIAAVNAFDTDRIVASFAADATSTTAAARSGRAATPSGSSWTKSSWATTSPWTWRSSTTTATSSSGPSYDGTYDKINLPDELIMSSYFSSATTRS